MWAVVFCVLVAQALAADCDAKDCSTCVQSTAFFGVLKCRWCPLDNSCRREGSLRNPCMDDQVLTSASSCPTTLRFTTYDQKEALYCAKLSRAAYDENFLSPDNLPEDFSVLADFKMDISHIEGTLRAFIGVSSDKQRLYLVNRGTTGLSPQLLAQANTSFVTFRGFRLNQYYGRHGPRFWESVIRDKFLQISAKNPTFNWTFTGHSLGGALASIQTFLAGTANLALGTGFNVYTFGQPRVGDASYVAVIERLFPGRYFRVVNKNDPVPNVPNLKDTRAWGPAVHNGAELWYNKQASCLWKECVSGEDRNCSASVPDVIRQLSINDHDMAQYERKLEGC